jgi:hypothetical protein
MEILDAFKEVQISILLLISGMAMAFPNFRVAAGLLETKRQDITNILHGKWFTAFPVPFRTGVYSVH